ncbi:MAG TPA: RpiB/LacA/LacB family sugar-phosphate isomerase [Acidimicrobiales bacterium]|nr:RpiB/LacA/LacB family sugar-phosphate isomerase [Acidimicrobiales bacterium]
MVVSMRIAIGSDHAGYELKTLLKTTLFGWGYDVLDLGTDSASEPVDYPDFGAAVGRAVVSRDADLGVACCGSGIGIAMAANKVPGVRAAVVHDVTSGHLAREHNHANVLCMGGRLTGTIVAVEALAAWLNATPQPRHEGRIEKLRELDLELAREEK